VRDKFLALYSYPHKASKRRANAPLGSLELQAEGGRELAARGKFLPPAGRRRPAHAHTQVAHRQNCAARHAIGVDVGFLAVGTAFALAIGKGDFMFQNVFGIHEQALLLHGQRLGVLASNIANVDTPNYKARDIDFSAVLSGTDDASMPLAVTQPKHLSLSEGGEAQADLKYRNPYQASLDGNTVEMAVEQAAFAENNVRYQASLGFINGRIAELTLAINGQ
jgi:flagellar basal-body rod protein FlgB